MTRPKRCSPNLVFLHHSGVCRVEAHDGQGAGQALAAGVTENRILEDFPYLTADDIQACYAFAAAREAQASVDRQKNFCLILRSY